MPKLNFQEVNQGPGKTFQIPRSFPRHQCLDSSGEYGYDFTANRLAWKACMTLALKYISQIKTHIIYNYSYHSAIEIKINQMNNDNDNDELALSVNSFNAGTLNLKPNQFNSNQIKRWFLRRGENWDTRRKISRG